MKNRTTYSFEKLYLVFLFLVPVFVVGCSEEEKEDSPIIVSTELGVELIFSETNYARQYPAQYAAILESRSDANSQAVQVAINFLKSQSPLPPFIFSRGMSQSALDHCKDMFYNNWFEHNGTDGSTPGDRINRYGKWLNNCGENIARGYPTARHLISAWIISPGHRDNMFGNYTYMGCNYYSDYAAQVFAGGYQPNMQNDDIITEVGH